MKTWAEFSESVLRSHRDESLSTAYRVVSSCAYTSRRAEDERGNAAKEWVHENLQGADRDQALKEIDSEDAGPIAFPRLEWMALSEATSPPPGVMGTMRSFSVLVALAIEHAEHEGGSALVRFEKNFIILSSLRVEPSRPTRERKRTFTLAVEADLGKTPKHGCEVRVDLLGAESFDSDDEVALQCWACGEPVPERHLRVLPFQDGPTSYSTDGEGVVGALLNPSRYMKAFTGAVELSEEVERRHGDRLREIGQSRMTRPAKKAEIKNLEDGVREGLRRSAGCLEDGWISVYSVSLGNEILVQIGVPLRRLPDTADPNQLDFSGGGRKGLGDACSLIVAVLERAAKGNADEATFAYTELADILNEEDPNRWRARVDSAIAVGQGLRFKIGVGRHDTYEFNGWDVNRTKHQVTFLSVRKMAGALRFFLEPTTGKREGRYVSFGTTYLPQILATETHEVVGLVRYILQQAKPNESVSGGDCPNWAPPLDSGSRFTPALGHNSKLRRNGFTFAHLVSRSMAVPMPTGRTKADRRMRSAVLEAVRDAKRILGGEWWIRRSPGRWLELDSAREINATDSLYPYLASELYDRLRGHLRTRKGQLATTDGALAEASKKAVEATGTMPRLSQAALDAGRKGFGVGEDSAKALGRVRRGLPIPAAEAEALGREIRTGEEAKAARIDRVAKAVHLAITRRGISRAEVARRAGISKAALTYLLKDRRAGDEVLGKVEEWLG